jgi:prepilin-type N-terminal cleavage/methylation domain-containing protein
MNRRRINRALSLVELIIVIVILGIIAAISIPRISSGSRNESESVLRANLTDLRNAIDWYYSEHHNTFPAQAGDGTNAADSEGAFINQLTMYSDATGTVSSAKDPLFPFGPYVRGSFPALPIGDNKGMATVAMVNQAGPLTATPSNGKGWVYNTQTGEIIANSDNTANDGTTFDTW